MKGKTGAFSLRSWTSHPDPDNPQGFFISFQESKDDYIGVLTTQYSDTKNDHIDISSTIVADLTSFKNYIPPDK